jgi:UPF0755 protein
MAKHKHMSQTNSTIDQKKSKQAPTNSKEMAHKPQKTSRVFLILLIIVVLAAVTTIAIGLHLAQPLNPQAKELVKIVIPKGRSVTQVANLLQEKKIIKSSLVFKIYCRLNQDRYQIQAGSFELSPSMDLAAILRTLSEGADDIWITFPEGLRREEIAQSLSEYGLQSYNEQEFLSLTVGLEGQLFPDTYLVPKEITTQNIVNLMQDTFNKRITSLQSDIQQSQYTLNQILTMASLLEREARGLEEMKLVSGVLWKRLEKGMPLQVDATLQYAMGYDESTQSWWSAPLAGNKQFDSKFNTYLNPGLPPHPICNPGLDAITAALRPAQSEYWYYLHDPQGQIHFGRTLEEHNQNVNQYLR